MTDKFKKIDRQYVLSDSSVNEYGFRLLTSGYQIEAFQKNPIGYYMHKREDGIALKWEDMRIEDDKVIGTPVINLSNLRGEQICDEAENGFLNAASVGHIVVVEYSTDAELMLPGQTGPTITKWYNKECSLVDIPGNRNALTRLYDAQENEINLVDLGREKPIVTILQNDTMKELVSILQLSDKADESGLLGAVKQLVSRIDIKEGENLALRQEIDALNNEGKKAEVRTILDRALEDRKITVELKEQLAADYATNPDRLSILVNAMPAYRSIKEHLNSKQPDSAEAQWHWDDFEKNDPAGNKLRDLRANDPVRYKELFDRKFAA